MEELSTLLRSSCQLSQRCQGKRHKEDIMLKDGALYDGYSSNLGL
jgi:hypothetical protein